jgi:hypothetical protein
MDTTRLLRAALALRGITAGAFAQTLAPPVSESMLYAVAAGRKTSDRVARAIAELIAAEGLPRAAAGRSLPLAA